MARVNLALGFHAQDNFPSDLTDGRESTKGFLGQQAPATARHTSRRICPPSPPPGGRSCSARRLKSFSRPSPNSGEMIIFQSRGSPAFCQRSRTFRRHNDFALVAKSAGFVALRCTVAGDVAPFARHCPLVLFGEYITRTTHRWLTWRRPPPDPL